MDNGFAWIFPSNGGVMASRLGISIKYEYLIFKTRLKGIQLRNGMKCLQCNVVYGIGQYSACIPQI